MHYRQKNPYIAGGIKRPNKAVLIRPYVPLNNFVIVFLDIYVYIEKKEKGEKNICLTEKKYYCHLLLSY